VREGRKARTGDFDWLAGQNQPNLAFSPFSPCFFRGGRGRKILMGLAVGAPHSPLYTRDFVKAVEQVVLSIDVDIYIQYNHLFVVIIK
jgi:hypothetical protein